MCFQVLAPCHILGRSILSLCSTKANTHWRMKRNAASSALCLLPPRHTSCESKVHNGNYFSFHMNPYILQIPLLDCKSDVPDEWELVAFELKETL